MADYLIDTNILVYHTAGTRVAVEFVKKAIQEGNFNISILTKIEFLGWDKHTSRGFEKCRSLIELANVYPLDEQVADKAVEIKSQVKIKIGDAIIAATAIVNDLELVTRNIDDFKRIKGLKIKNLF